MENSFFNPNRFNGALSVAFKQLRDQHNILAIEDLETTFEQVLPKMDVNGNQYPNHPFQSKAKPSLSAYADYDTSKAVYFKAPDRNSVTDTLVLSIRGGKAVRDTVYSVLQQHGLKVSIEKRSLKVENLQHTLCPSFAYHEQGLLGKIDGYNPKDHNPTLIKAIKIVIQTLKQKTILEEQKYNSDLNSVEINNVYLELEEVDQKLNKALLDAENILYLLNGFISEQKRKA